MTYNKHLINREKQRKTVSGILVLLLIGTVILTSSTQLVKTEPRTIVPDDYPTIQEAINAADPGDTIYVRSGTYYENIVANKTVLLIGENGKSVMDGKSLGTVVHIEANNVTISGFTIQNSGIEKKAVNVVSVAGIELDGDGCNISRNSIINNEKGIYLHMSFHNVFEENNITNNHHAIAHWCSEYNIMRTNVIANNSGCGIFLGNSFHVKLVANTVIHNEVGIYLYFSSNNMLRNNSMIGNKYNFGVSSIHLSSFYNDVDTSNKVDGKPIYYWVNKENQTVPPDAGYVALVSSTNVTVKNLHLKNNAEGILLVNTTNSLITNNTVTNNNIGIWLYGSSNNSFYHNNFINNTWQVCELGPPIVEHSINIWDEGYPSGGNYWSDYTGVDEFSGPNQDLPGSDGIGDTPYTIDANNTDRYPLMNPWPSRDIAITSLTVSKDFPSINETVSIYVTVQNRGQLNETFTLTLNCTGPEEGHIGSQTLKLAPRTQTTLSFTWTPTAWGIYEINAYTSPIPEDINPQDNTKTTRIVVVIHGLGGQAFKKSFSVP